MRLKILEFKLRKEMKKNLGPYGVHFIRRDSPYGMHFVCRDCSYGVHFNRRDCPYG